MIFASTDVLIQIASLAVLEILALDARTMTDRMTDASQMVDAERRQRMPYIDRDALKNLTVKKNGIWDSISDSFGRGLSEIIDSIPTADVIEVVRCKDCKYKEIEQPGMVYCPMMVGSWVADDHFCKWGERREDENC